MKNENYETGILITGASGGLGRALVEEAFSLPDVDRIVATDISPGVLEMSHHEKVIPLIMDSASEKSIAAVAGKLKETAVKIKYIVNTAGVFTLFPVSESNEKLLDAIVRVNVYGPILTVSAFVDDLAETGGRVVQISSDSVKLPTLFQPYPATKTALEAFGTSMRQELALLGVKLIIVRPGAMKTNLISEMKNLKNPVTGSRFSAVFDDFVRLAQKDVGKAVEPGIVAKLVMKALTSKKPRIIYSINKNKKISLLTKFPQRMIDRLILKTVGK